MLSYYSVLQDGITHPTDTALRDFSARCLYEFVVWSVKQKSPLNVKATMKRIFSLSLHPSPSKRLGEFFSLMEFSLYWEKKVKIKVKQSRYSPGVAQKAPES